MTSETKAPGWWALLTPVGVFGILVIATLAVSLAQNSNNFVYPLDDTYIHMSMAKNLAYHGVWGVTRYEFTSASSSPLYTSLLALCYWILGVREALPLSLCVVFAIVTLAAAYRILRKHDRHPAFIAFVLLALLFFTPLVALAFTGMEHTLHLLLTMLFVYASARVIACDQASNGTRILVAMLATLLPVIRYEGLFTVAVVCLLLLLVKRRVVYAVVVGALALLPLALFGAFSVSHGWYPLPNSVLLKGSIPDFASLSGIGRTLFTGYFHAIAAPHLAVLAIAALFVLFTHFKRGGAFQSIGAVMLIIFLGNLALHLQFAKSGWVYRYESYLVALGIFTMGMSMPMEAVRNAWRGKISQRATAILLVSLLAAPLAIRGGASLLNIPQATTNIHEQQYQMAAFLREHYQGRTVAANDIGAINYFADIRTLDLFGLANMDVARAKRANEFDTERLAEIAADHNADIALVYTDWYDAYGGLPREWIKIGEWQTLNNEILGGDTVSFYAVDPAERDRLSASFRSFSSRLPKTMIWRAFPQS